MSLSASRRGNVRGVQITTVFRGRYGQLVRVATLSTILVATVAAGWYFAVDGAALTVVAVTVFVGLALMIAVRLIFELNSAIAQLTNRAERHATEIDKTRRSTHEVSERLTATAKNIVDARSEIAALGDELDISVNRLRVDVDRLLTSATRVQSEMEAVTNLIKRVHGEVTAELAALGSARSDDIAEVAATIQAVFDHSEGHA